MTSECRIKKSTIWTNEEMTSTPSLAGDTDLHDSFSSSSSFYGMVRGSETPTDVRVHARLDKIGSQQSCPRYTIVRLCNTPFASWIPSESSNSSWCLSPTRTVRGEHRSLGQGGQILSAGAGHALEEDDDEVEERGPIVDLVLQAFRVPTFSDWTLFPVCERKPSFWSSFTLEGLVDYKIQQKDRKRTDNTRKVWTGQEGTICCIARYY